MKNIEYHEHINQPKRQNARILKMQNINFTSSAIMTTKEGKSAYIYLTNDGEAILYGVFKPEWWDTEVSTVDFYVECDKEDAEGVIRNGMYYAKKVQSNQSAPMVQITESFADGTKSVSYQALEGFGFPGVSLDNAKVGDKIVHASGTLLEIVSADDYEKLSAR